MPDLVYVPIPNLLDFILEQTTFAEDVKRLSVMETVHDQYWNQAIHLGVNNVGARLEQRAYKHIAEKGVSLLALGDDARDGVWFHTPLSQSPCSDNKVNTDMIKALHDYIEARFTFIGPDPCEELVFRFRTLLKYPESCMDLSQNNLRYSYDKVRESVLAPDCKEEFCRQLSDQLVHCERCGQRPILYSVIRDEDSMKRHLSDHKLEQESEDHMDIKEKLLSKLDNPPLLPLLRESD